MGLLQVLNSPKQHKETENLLCAKLYTSENMTKSSEVYDTMFNGMCQLLSIYTITMESEPFETGTI